MLDVIDALRNNNLRKIPQYDPSLVENARKQMRAILKTRGLFISCTMQFFLSIMAMSFAHILVCWDFCYVMT